MRFRILVVAFVMLAAACGDSTSSTTSATTAATTTTVAATTATAATTTTESGFMVTSDDGDLTIAVPVAAMAEDPGITIRVLGADEYPPELAGAAENPNARIYSVEPEGLVFDAPVTVTRRIDTANFPDLTPNDVPAVILVTRSADGTYEPYSDLSIDRNGPDVFVSGTITHFSPVVTLSEQSAVSVTLGSGQLEALPSARSFNDILTLSTEVGGTIQVTAGYHDQSGGALMPPAMSGWLDLGGPIRIESGITPQVASVTCDQIGTMDVVYGAFATYGVGDPTSAALRSLPQLNSAITSLDMKFSLHATVRCFDPKTSILGIDLSGFEIASDHPGGKEWIPGGDFRGGLSGAYAWLGSNERLSGIWGGLIMDDNGNGIVDSNDAMYPPYPAEEMGDMYGYVAPLFTFGMYFVYLYDGTQYSAPPAPSGSTWTVGEGLDAFMSNYTGMGRFESSIGIVGSGGSPFTYDVDAGEEAQQLPDPGVIMFPGLRVQF